MPDRCFVQDVNLRKRFAVPGMDIWLLQRVLDAGILTNILVPVTINAIPGLAFQTSAAGVNQYHWLDILVAAREHLVSPHYLYPHVHPVISLVQLLQYQCFWKAFMVVLHVHD